MIKRYKTSSVRKTIQKVAQALKPNREEMERINNALKAPPGWVYFLRSGALIKIGYSCDIPKRMAAYATHNPDAQLMVVTPGTRDDEKNYQNRFGHLRIKLEWFSFGGELAELLNKLMRTEAAQ
jgi:hypothetical protein